MAHKTADFSCVKVIDESDQAILVHFVDLDKQLWIPKSQIDDDSEVMKPTIGIIVHYMNFGDSENKYPPETQAAIITKVNQYDDVISLKIFSQYGIFDRSEVKFSATPARGCWSWPPLA